MANEGSYFHSAVSQIATRASTSPVINTTETRERAVKTVPPPVTYLPSEEQLFLIGADGRKKPNEEFLKQHFRREGRVTEEQALYLLAQGTAVLSAERNLLKVPGPANVCGDIHGQYYDLMKLFEIGGSLLESNYLFLGDYVDRGYFGIECFLYLLSLKINYPDRIYMLRGNHECRQLTEYFTFRQECFHKYSETVYDACLQAFQALPLAAILDGRFFCVHGGLSPELDTLADLERISRFEEPASHGLLCDLLWSDPIQNYGHEHEPSDTAEPLPHGTLWVHNAMRGCSFNFTYAAACKFLDRNELLGIIRGHEAQDSGYTMHRKTQTKKFPSVITIFSAPNYLDVYNNKAAILKYANKNITIRQFHNVAHPYWLPNFMDAFTWSLPFVGSKIADMLLAILSICSPEELDDSSDSDPDDTRSVAEISLTPNEIYARREQIKAKILAVGRMQKVFKMLREESENRSELAVLSDLETGAGPGVQIPVPDGPSGSTILGLDKLGVKGTAIGRQIQSFADARRLDIANERLPTSPTSAPNTPNTETGGMSTSMHPPSMQRRSSMKTEDTTAYMRRVLLERDEEDEALEKLAERIARGGGKGVGPERPAPLKRYGTA